MTQIASIGFYGNRITINVIPATATFFALSSGENVGIWRDRTQDRAPNNNSPLRYVITRGCPIKGVATNCEAERNKPRQ